MKRTVATWLAGLAALLLLLAVVMRPEIASACKNTALGGFGDRVLATIGLKPVADECAVETVPHAQRALERLYGTFTRLDPDTLQISSTEIARLWFAQSFQEGFTKYFVVFGQIQSYEKDPDFLRCHACHAKIGQITYRQLKNGQWKIISTQKNLGEIGSWGSAPDIHRADIYHLSKKNTWLLFDEYITGQGYTEKYKNIISHTNGHWRLLGSSLMAEDNSGNCSDDPEERRDLGVHSCWAYDATSIELTVGKNPGYPDVVINYAGTTSDREKTIIAVVPARYAFDGVVYGKVAP